MKASEPPMVNTLDMEILLHRDCHFSSLFDEMIDYYKKGGVGAVDDFEVEEIERLANLEKKLGENLSSRYLNDTAKEIVRSCKDMYQQLRKVYEQESPDPKKLLISDLILTEEEYPEKVIAGMLMEKEVMLPLLIPILSSEHFYNPLYPGYGRAPALAALVLGKIGDPEAIPHLFNALGEDNFFTDDAIINALVSFEEQTLDYLKPKLKGKPFTNDNERAAIVLASFPGNEHTSNLALDLLEHENSLTKPIFASYLISACSALKMPGAINRFKALSTKPGLSSELKNEIAIVSKNLKSDN